LGYPGKYSFFGHDAFAYLTRGELSTAYVSNEKGNIKYLVAFIPFLRSQLDKLFIGVNHLTFNENKDSGAVAENNLLSLLQGTDSFLIRRPQRPPFDL
jgi:hypothetical protein